MKRSIRIFFQKRPVLYNFLYKTYFSFRKLLGIRLFGINLQNWIWKNRGFFYNLKKAKNDFLNSVNAVNYPHKIFLTSRILSFTSIESVLEFGCSTGFNLYLLASKNPNIKFYGIDINRRFINVGKDIIREKGINNVFLSCSRNGLLETFGDKSIDIIFTNAVMLYIDPHKIHDVINDMIRVARKRIIFSEWHKESPNGREYFQGNWVYNYNSLLSKYSHPENIRITKITKELWDNDLWSDLGYVIELNVENLQLQ